VIAIRPPRFEISRERAERTRLTVVFKTGLVDYRGRFRIRVSQVYPLSLPVLQTSYQRVISALVLGWLNPSSIVSERVMGLFSLEPREGSHLTHELLSDFGVIRGWIQSVPFLSDRISVILDNCRGTDEFAFRRGVPATTKPPRSISAVW